MVTLFTVGHGARPIGTLVAVLRDASAGVLVDVRRFPGSRRHPHFGRAALAATLAGAGIGYEWQGEALGGRRTRGAGLCAETLWWRCHRMLIADASTLRGAAVVHLLDVGRHEPHRLHSTVRRGDDGWPVYDVADTLPGLG